MPRGAWRERLRRIIFESDTAAGRRFDQILLVVILLSVLAVVLESVPAVRRDHGLALRAAEWLLTLAFTVEYVLRLLSAPRPWRYARSFFGVVDLLAILPTYLSLVFAETQPLMVIRAIRLLRVFRVLKLGRYMTEAEGLVAALAAARRKIIVFFGGVVTLNLVIGTLMYTIEGEEAGFTSIPVSVYWAIVTTTTVGYGDMVPTTALGRALAAFAMLLGYSIIAVPTGIVSVELARTRRTPRIACPGCEAVDHDPDAVHCKHCGTRL
ncbi:MAG TPA: ion transporter [Candidatus Tectomicrobia bacterium]|nr:ion transporter [Candidatus Tectomicrobia bacterium]